MIVLTEATPFPDPIKIISSNSFREFTILIERVDDSQIRKELKAFNELMGSSLFSKSKIENETKLNKLRKDYTHLMDKIGIALRSNF